MTYITKLRSTILLLALLGTALAAAILGSPAFADGSPQIGVTIHQASGNASGVFQVQAQPGETVEAGTVEVVSSSDFPVEAQTDAVNGITNSMLGADYGGMTEHPVGAASWLDLGNGIISIAPDSSVLIPVAVQVPSTALPGDYLSGVSIYALNQDCADGDNFCSTTRLVVGVEVQIPGPSDPVVTLSGIKTQQRPQGVLLSLLANNPGNVILQNVTGSVVITSGGHLVKELTIEPGTFVSQTSIEYPIYLVPCLFCTPPSPTVYHVQATMTYAGGTAQLSQNVTVGGPPEKKPSSKQRPRKHHHRPRAES